VYGSLKVNDEEDLHEELKNTRKKIFEVKDMLFRYLSIHDKPRNKHGEGYSKKQEHVHDIYSHSEGQFSSQHNMDYY